MAGNTTSPIRKKTPAPQTAPSPAPVVETIKSRNYRVMAVFVRSTIKGQNQRLLEIRKAVEEELSRLNNAEIIPGDAYSKPINGININKAVGRCNDDLLCLTQVGGPVLNLTQMLIVDVRFILGRGYKVSLMLIDTATSVIEASADFDAKDRDVVSKTRQEVKLLFVIKPQKQPQAEAEPSPEPGTKLSESVALLPVNEYLPDPKPKAPERMNRWILPGIFTALSVVGAAYGGYSLVQARNKNDQAIDSPLQSNFENFRNDALTSNRIGNISFISSGVLFGAAVGSYFIFGGE